MDVGSSKRRVEGLCGRAETIRSLEFRNAGKINEDHNNIMHNIIFTYQGQTKLFDDTNR